MFLALWNYLHGYVMIRVTGFSVERFVNLAALKGIYIWDIHPDKTGVTMKVSIGGFRLLKECGRKTKCHYKILERYGLPFLLHHYKKRKILGIGIFVFVLGLYVLSSMIWVIEINGNDRISREEILEGCKEFGLKAGCFKFKIDTKEVSEGLIGLFDDISWIGVEMKGTNIKISIVETIPKTEIVDRTTPCDVVATMDGIITSIVTSAGTPLVKQKDVVRAGDILVSSEVILRDGEEEKGREYVRAKAEVKAKLWAELKEELPLQYDEKVYTGKKESDLSFHLGNKKLNFLQPSVDETNFEKVLLYEKPFAIGDYVFPIAVLKEEYREYKLEQKTRTVEEAEEELKQVLQKKADELVTEDGSILNIEFYFEQNNEKLMAKAVVTMELRIDEQRNLETIEQEKPISTP